MEYEVGALDPVGAMAQVFSDLAEATELFQELDLPPQEYLKQVERCYDDCGAIMSIVFTTITDSVRERISEEIWEAHRDHMVAKRRGQTQEQINAQVASVMRRLATQIPMPDDEEPGDSDV